MKEIGGEEDEDNCLVDRAYLCTDALVRDGNLNIYVVLFCRIAVITQTCKFLS